MTIFNASKTDIYISGGYSKDQMLDQFLKFDFDTEKWGQDGNRIDQPRYHHKMSIFTTGEIDCSKAGPKLIVNNAWGSCSASYSQPSPIYSCMKAYLGSELMNCVPSTLCRPENPNGVLLCGGCLKCNSNCGACDQESFCWIFGCTHKCCTS